MKRNQLIRNIVPPVALAILVGTVWQVGVQVFQVEKFLLPSPVEVLRAMSDNAAEFASAARFTLTAALCGLVLSTAAGIAVAIVFSQSSIIRRSSYPYAIYLQTAPIVAIAPILAVWIGEGFMAIVVVVFIISLFPVIRNQPTCKITLSVSMTKMPPTSTSKHSCRVTSAPSASSALIGNAPVSPMKTWAG